MSLELFYGNAVTGKQRFARPPLEARLRRQLVHSAGVKMFGLRRIGKSTLTLYAQEELRRLGYTVIAVDAQGMRSLDQLLFGVFGAVQDGDGFFGRFTRWATSNDALPQALRTGLGAAVRGLAKHDPDLARSVGDYWPTISAQIVRRLREDQPNLLLTIDELPFMIQNMIDGDKAHGRMHADALLASLREWRGAGCKMVITGSIGMTGLARKHRLTVDHINDLSDFQVPPLTTDEARGFVDAATRDASHGKWTEAHSEALLREAGVLYPCFLVKGLLAVGVDDPPPPETFHTIFADEVRPMLHSSFLEQFNRRFHLYRELPANQERKLILPVLRQIMAAGAVGCAQDDVKLGKGLDRIDVQDGLTMLQEDGFIRYYEERGTRRLWCPASQLVEHWWQQAAL